MLVRWDPFKEIERLHDEINKVFSTSNASAQKDGEGRVAWYPMVDIYEDAENVMITAELPGIEAKDVDVQVNGDVLTLRGERKLEKDEKKENYVRVERAYGTFMRSFTLPDYVASDKINAEYKKGVLTLTLPKKPETKPKQIAVKVKGD